MINSTSAVIIVKNGAATIKNTLGSLKEFPEVVVYDSGSTDNTLEIAKSYPNVKVVEGEFIGFGETKQKAVSVASNDWILSLDADECASVELIKYLKALSNIPPEEMVFKVIRHNFFMGKHIDKAGWGNDWLIRIFNRRVHNFNNAKVHEKVELNNRSIVKKLTYAIEHDAVQEVGQFLEKANRYSEIRRQSSMSTYPLIIILLKAFWRFFRSYMLQGGFLAGWRGLVISWSNANGVFFKYIKIYADKHK
jgi:glycosyltransferase involved in cell wall biosynthesis